LDSFCKYSMNLMNLNLWYYKDDEKSFDNIFSSISSKLLKAINLHNCTLSQFVASSLGMIIHRVSIFHLYYILNKNETYTVYHLSVQKL
jgi:hypothetical protein